MAPKWMRPKEVSSSQAAGEGPAAPEEIPAASGTAEQVPASAVPVNPEPRRNPAERLRLWSGRPDPEYERQRLALAEINSHVYTELQHLPADTPEAVRDDLARKAALNAVAHLKPPPAQGQITVLVEKAISRLNGRLGPLQPYMLDDAVTEILINAPDEVVIERAGRLEFTPVRFDHDDEVESLVSSLASRVGARFDNSAPILDCPLDDGSRLAAVRWPIARRGTLVSIRKFGNMPNLNRMVAQGAVPSIHSNDKTPVFMEGHVFPVGVDTEEFLTWAMRNRINVVFYGATSSGKTTTMNAIMELIPRELRVIIIEDSLELQPPPEMHVVRLTKRISNVQDKGEITLTDLLKASLRLRPDMLIVGECRKDEVAVLYEAWNTGHDGGMTSVHAPNPMECIDRLARMLNEGKPSMTLQMATQSLAKTLQVVVQMARDSSPNSQGRRLMQRITAVEGIDSRGNVVLNDLYHWTPEGWRSTGHVPAWAVAPKGGAA